MAHSGKYLRGKGGECSSIMSIREQQHQRRERELGDKAHAVVKRNRKLGAFRNLLFVEAQMHLSESSTSYHVKHHLSEQKVSNQVSESGGRPEVYSHDVVAREHLADLAQFLSGEELFFPLVKKHVGVLHGHPSHQPLVVCGESRCAQRPRDKYCGKEAGKKKTTTRTAERGKCITKSERRR